MHGYFRASKINQRRTQGVRRWRAALGLTAAVVASSLLLAAPVAASGQNDPLPSRATVSPRPTVKPAPPLPVSRGEVAVTTPALPRQWKSSGKRFGAPKTVTSSSSGTAAPASKTSSLSPTVEYASFSTTAPTLATATAPAVSTNKVGLRALVVATDSNDYGLPTWTSMLDSVGAAYDVVLADSQPITPEMLIAADGSGRYNAILLTNNVMILPQADGTYAQVVDANEWNTLWAYERDYAVRQATLYASYGTFPEDYCLRQGSEGGVLDTPLPANLTSAGATIFDELQPKVTIPITQSYVYSDTVDTSCATPILTSGATTLGVTSTSTDGRERMALTFSNNQYLLQSTLLTYGMFRWATHGLFLGQKQHYLKLDVDDYFGGADLIQPDRTIKNDAYSMSGNDILNVSNRQSALRSSYPLANNFKMTLAYNGVGANPWTICWPFGGGTSALSASTKCVINQFEWINHTYSHLALNSTNLATTTSEITKNLTAASQFGLPVDKTILKTGEYSGLGTYNPTNDDGVEPPTDFGLMASNPNLITAAKNTGVQYLHGNMSFLSQRPACFNCNTPHPMDTSIAVVPDWPTNIAYFSSNQAEETTFYNWYYGPGGLFPYFSTPQTYPQILDNESNVALQHMASGSIYTHTMHIANLRNYGSGRTLATDWLDATLKKYTSLYKVPVQSPSWRALAVETSARNGHFALKDTVSAVYDPTTQKVTVTSPASGKLQLSGALAPGAITYGTSTISTVSLTAGAPATWSVKRLP